MELDELRGRLDGIDEAMIALLEQRMGVVEDVARIKRVSGAPIYDEERERAVHSGRAAMVKNAAYAEYAHSLVCNLLASSRRLQRRLMNVYLIGMPGAGKTRLARAAAERTGLPIMDTDELIETLSGRSISGLFSDGEETFRRFECEALRRAAEAGGSIVATGGGVIKLQSNVELMRQSGRVVFLDRALERLILEDHSMRPLISGAADVERLYEERYEAYRAAADFVLDPDDKNALDDLSAYCVE